MTETPDRPEEDIVFEDTQEDEVEIGHSFTPMHFDTMQRKVKDLMSDYIDGDLDPRPSFQRGYVWDKKRASRLVESILLNVPLPLVYTAEEEDQTEVVIDGQQRLLSVFGFITGKFPKDGSGFKLSGLKLLEQLNGKDFKSLEDKERKAIQRYIFQIIRISNNSHPDVKFEIFERLNSGSVTLNAQELRNCVYRGTFNDTLRELANFNDFKKMLGTSTVSNRMQDSELVLRFLAFYEKTYLNYSSGMKSFLNEFMHEYRNPSKEKTASFENAFKQAASMSFSIFGENAFRKFSVGTAADPGGSWERPINRPLFDIVMWGFTRFEKNQIMKHSDEIRNAFIELTTTDSQFIDAITSATGDKGKTQFRFEVWHERLKAIVQSSTQTRVFPASLKKKLFEYDPTCSICSQQIHSLDDAHVDHIVPFSKGGATTEDNAQIAHRYCNLRKSSSSQ